LPKQESKTSTLVSNQGEAFKQLEHEISQINEERYDQLNNRTTPSVTPSYNMETSNFEMPQKKIIESPK
jgi:hypothetical protein